MSQHEFLQAVIMKASKKQIRKGAKTDQVEFVSWLLNILHANLRTSKKNSSSIYECLQVLSLIYDNLIYLDLFTCFLDSLLVRNISMKWLTLNWMDSKSEAYELVLIYHVLLSCWYTFNYLRAYFLG